MVPLRWREHHPVAGAATSKRKINWFWSLRRFADRCQRRLLAPIYQLYEHRLLRQLSAGAVPRHIGLILDGNRRFARETHLARPDEVYTVQYRDRYL